MSQPAPSEVVEVKRSLSGAEKTFACRLIDTDAHLAVLRYVSTEPRTLHGVELATGTVTFGYFWSDRPYNVYHWLRPAGQTIAYYLNVADQTSIGNGRLEWRDLTVDILITPSGEVQVLDLDEIPADIDTVLRAFIDRATATILGSRDAIVAEVEARSRTLWPRASDAR